jgi:hypothetical protein
MVDGRRANCAALRVGAEDVHWDMRNSLPLAARVGTTPAVSQSTKEL